MVLAFVPDILQPTTNGSFFTWLKKGAAASNLLHQLWLFMKFFLKNCYILYKTVSVNNAEMLWNAIEKCMVEDDIL